MRPPCQRCGTPLGATDTRCPACGVSVHPAAVPGSGGGRRPLLDTPVPGADTPPVSAPRPSPRGAGTRPGSRAGRPARAEGGRGPLAVGTVTGEVSRTRVAAIGPGRRVLVQAAAVLAAVALLVAVVVDRGLPGAVLLVAGLAPALLQALVLALRPRGSRAAPDEPEHATERWRFRVVEPSGRSVDCTLTGQLSDALRRGDIVEVYGRAPRDGTLAAREVVVVADQRSVRGRPDTAFLLTRTADATTVALAVVGVLAAAVAVLT